MRLTFLRPTAPWANTAKAYSAPQRSKKVSDYQLGTEFEWQNVYFNDLDHVCQELRRRHDEIAIYGIPTTAIDLIGPPQARKTENFEYPDKQVLHVFDLDKWVIPKTIREKIAPKLTDSFSMANLVDEMLRHEGFGILADAEKVVVLTSSMWDLNLLNVHLYVRFSKYVRVEAMREFATALAKVRQRTLFDPAVYKAVQPQFFTAPVCKGFRDPLEGKRIFMVHGEKEVDTDKWQLVVNRALDDAQWSPTASVSDLPAIGNDWMHTLTKFVGDAHGINQPAYRAAAQLVQQVGQQQAKEKINEYARQMHDAVWDALRASGSERGRTKEDKATYTVSRFRQYIQSALEKNFGEPVDELVNTVERAIDSKDLAHLTSSPVISALARLKSSHYAKFIPLEQKIKAEKLLTMGQLNKLLKFGLTIDAESSEADMISAALNNDNREASENIIVDAVLSKYEYYADYVGNKYVAVASDDGSGAYRMLRCTGELSNIFYVDGLEISGNTVSDRFGRKALCKLLGQDLRTVDGVFERRCIGKRIAMENSRIDGGTWLNLGEQVDGSYKTVCISTGGITVHDYKDTPVRWMHGVAPLQLATNEEIEERFGKDATLKEYLADTLPRFISVKDDEYPKLLMWFCSVLANKTNAYIAELTGPTGTGKSSSADLMKDLVDPSGGLLGSGSDRMLIKDASNPDFLSAIEMEWVSILDNVSKLNVNTQDILCAIATGIKHSERVLYTQTIMQRTIRRPLILTALAPVVTRPDLRSRVIGIEITKPDYNLHFLRDWGEEKPFLLAGLLEMTRDTLLLYRNVTQFPSGLNTRDVFLACVYSAMRGFDYVDYRFVHSFRVQEAADMAHDSRFINLLVAFLDHRHDGYIQYLGRDLHPAIRRYAQEYAGKEIGNYVVNMMDTPDSVRGMAWELTKSIDIINRVSTWDVLVDKDPSTKAKRYTFIRKEGVGKGKDMTEEFAELSSEYYPENELAAFL